MQRQPQRPLHGKRRANAERQLMVDQRTHHQAATPENGCINPSAALTNARTFWPQKWGSLERATGIAIDTNRSNWFTVTRAILQNHNDTLIDKWSQVGVCAARVPYHPT